MQYSCTLAHNFTCESPSEQALLGFMVEFLFPPMYGISHIWIREPDSLIKYTFRSGIYPLKVQK